MYATFIEEGLDDRHVFYRGKLPTRLLPSADAFAELWALHPEDFHEINLFGRLVKTPRWQQAYGKDYHYSGQTNRALPIPDTLRTFHDWARKQIDSKLNGLLVNWYDGQFGHYIGKHRDSITDLLDGAPIVTISFGETRTFRLRPWRRGGYCRFPGGERSRVYHALRHEPGVDTRGAEARSSGTSNLRHVVGVPVARSHYVTEKCSAPGRR